MLKKQTNKQTNPNFDQTKTTHLVHFWGMNTLVLPRIGFLQLALFLVLMQFLKNFDRLTLCVCVCVCVCVYVCVCVCV